MRKEFLTIFGLIFLLTFLGCTNEGQKVVDNPIKIQPQINITPSRITFESCNNNNQYSGILNCYIDLAVQDKNSSICEKISESRTLRDNCYKKVAIVTINQSLCEKIYDQTNIRPCKADLIDNANETIDCNQFKDQELYNVCKEKNAIFTKNVSICKESNDSNFVNACIASYSQKYADQSVCKEITSRSLMRLCDPSRYAGSSINETSLKPIFTISEAGIHYSKTLSLYTNRMMFTHSSSINSVRSSEQYDSLLLNETDYNRTAAVIEEAVKNKERYSNSSTNIYSCLIRQYKDGKMASESKCDWSFVRSVEEIIDRNV